MWLVELITFGTLKSLYDDWAWGKRWCSCKEADRAVSKLPSPWSSERKDKLETGQ